MKRIHSTMCLIHSINNINRLHTGSQKRNGECRACQYTGHKCRNCQKTKIQVAILLDTSGSMQGLIEQAKSRLWNIVNTLTTLKYKGRDTGNRDCLIRIWQLYAV